MLVVLDQDDGTAAALQYAEQVLFESRRRKELEAAADRVKYDEALTFARARADLQGSQFLASCETWLAEHGFLSKNQIAALMPLEADVAVKRRYLSDMLETVMQRRPKDRFVLSLHAFFQDKGYLSKKQTLCLEELVRKADRASLPDEREYYE